MGALGGLSEGDELRKEEEKAGLNFSDSYPCYANL